jgi:hypothetical protein
MNLQELLSSVLLALGPFLPAEEAPQSKELHTWFPLDSLKQEKGMKK